MNQQIKNNQKQFTQKQALHIKRRKRNQMLSKGGLIAVIIVFVCCLGILGQRLFIAHLDQQVQTLKNEVDSLRSENDAKQGVLTESQDDTKIKATARSYGMKEASADQKIVETISEQDIDDTALNQNQWIHRLLE